jgi:hypothetical protein
MTPAPRPFTKDAARRTSYDVAKIQSKFDANERIANRM